MIGNIGVMGEGRTGGALGGKSGRCEIHGPENHSGCVKVDTPGGHDAADFGPVAGKVAAGVWDTPAEEKCAASGAGHVMEAGAGVEVMAAAGASSNGGALTAVAVGKSVAADTDDQVRNHRDLRWVI